MKVKKGIERLEHILPIKRTLDGLAPVPASLYLAVLHGFYEKGRAPFIAELEKIDKNARDSIAALAKQDMLTLDEHGEVEGCYPFTMQTRVHRIQLNGFTVHAMCAMDALAPSTMFNCNSVVLSECAVSKQAVRVELNDQTILNTAQVADLHFGINWAAAGAAGSCSETLCTEMLFLKDAATADAWLNEDADNREIYTLPEAIQFAAGFFRPLMQQG